MTVREQEELIRRYDHEWAFVWNDEGRLVLEKEGRKYGVEFTDEDVMLMKGAILTHNHPHGLNFDETDPRSFGHSFSEDDVHLACLAEMAEMRVVTPKLRFSMKPPLSGWSIDVWEAMIRPSYVKHYAEVWAELEAAVFASGTITPAMADVRVLHETWEKVAAEIGLIYTREEG